MKRTLLYIVALLALVSCQKDPDIPIVSLTVSDKVEAQWILANLSGVATANTKVNALYIQYSTDEGFGKFKEERTLYHDGQFGVCLSILAPQTTYYYRYRAANKLNTFNDKTIHSFRTNDFTVPGVSTDYVDNVTGKKATLYGRVDFNGAKPITEQGFEYGVDQTNLTKIPTITTDFSLQLLNLQFGTLYYYRAYATNEIGTGYGEFERFWTRGMAQFGEIKVDSITTNSAVVEYSVLANDGMPILKQGIQYWQKGATDSTTMETKKMVKLTKLEENQTYQLRAFAETEDDRFYSAVSEFTTLAYIPPTVSTLDVTHITDTSATCRGTVTYDGGLTITERGICYSTSAAPTISDTKIVASDASAAIFSCAMSDLTKSTTYYVRAYAINNKGVGYGEEKIFSTADGKEAGHVLVDLGLSVKWATMNIGAASETDCGNYYAWGETSTKTDYSGKTYTLGDGKYSPEMTKYTAKDKKRTLEAEDDAAHVNWGGNWRMPKKAEADELVENCTITWTTDYQGTGVRGCIFTSKKEGYTGKSIFLPATGHYAGTTLYDSGIGQHWTSSLMETLPDNAYQFYCRTGEFRCCYFSRCGGRPIRPVCP